MTKINKVGLTNAHDFVATAIAALLVALLFFLVTKLIGVAGMAAVVGVLAFTTLRDKP